MTSSEKTACSRHSFNMSTVNKRDSLSLSAEASLPSDRDLWHCCIEKQLCLTIVVAGRDVGFAWQSAKKLRIATGSPQGFAWLEPCAPRA
jgi:hypothetical protein